MTSTAEDDERERRSRMLITVNTLLLAMVAPLPLWFVRVPWWVLVLVPVVVLAGLFVVLGVLGRRARSTPRVVLALAGDERLVNGREVPLSSVTGAAVLLAGTEQDDPVASQIRVQLQDGEELTVALARRPTPEVREIYRRLRQRLKPQGVRVSWQPGAGGPNGWK